MASLRRGHLLPSTESMSHLPMSFNTFQLKKEPQSTFFGDYLNASSHEALSHLSGPSQSPAIRDSISCISEDEHSHTKKDIHFRALESESSSSQRSGQEPAPSFPAWSQPISRADTKWNFSSRSRSPSSELPTEVYEHQVFQESTKSYNDQYETLTERHYHESSNYSGSPICTYIDHRPEDASSHPLQGSSGLWKGPEEEIIYRSTSTMRSFRSEAVPQSDFFIPSSGEITASEIGGTATVTQNDLHLQQKLEMSTCELISNPQGNSDTEPRAMVNSIYSAGASIEQKVPDDIQVEISRDRHSSRKQELILEIEDIDREIADVESLLKELEPELSMFVEENLDQPIAHKSRIVFENLTDVHLREAAVSCGNVENKDAGFKEEPISNPPWTSLDFHMDNIMYTKLSKYMCWNWQRTLKHELDLTEEFEALSSLWKRKIQRIEKRLNQKAPPPTTNGFREAFQSSSILNRSTMYMPGRRVRGDIVRSEAELELVMLQLAEEERINPDRRFLTTLADIPPMILDEDSMRSEIFFSVNGLMDNCDKLLESKIRVWWREEEEKIFIEKYLEFPKSFGRIASYLHGKTAEDCVEFYYRNKKRLNLKRLVRKDLIRKKKLGQRFPEADLDRDMAGSKASELHSFAEYTPFGTSLARYGQDEIDQNTRDLEKIHEIREQEHTPLNVGECSLSVIQTPGLSQPIRPEWERPHDIHEVHCEQTFKSISTSMEGGEIKDGKLPSITSSEGFALVETSNPKRGPIETPHSPLQLVLPPDPNGNRIFSTWSDEECRLFMKYFHEYGGNCDRLAELITTKSKSQIEHFFQVYRKALDLRDPRFAAHLTQMAWPNIYSNSYDPNLFRGYSNPNELVNLDLSNNYIPPQFVPFSPFPHTPARFPTNFPIAPYNVMPKPLFPAHYRYSSPPTFPNFYGTFMVPMIPFGMYNPTFGNEVYARSFWGMAPSGAAARPFIGEETVFLSPEVCSNTEGASDSSQNSQNIPEKMQTESTPDGTTNP